MWTVYKNRPEQQAEPEKVPEEVSRQYSISFTHICMDKIPIFYIGGNGRALIDWGPDGGEQIKKLRAMTNETTINYNPDEWLVPNPSKNGVEKTVTVYGKITGFYTCCTENIMSLNVENMPTLRYLHVYREDILSVDLSKNPALKRLVCANAGLLYLDVSHNPLLRQVTCEENRMDRDELVELFESLPRVPYGEQAVITCFDNPGYEDLTPEDRRIVKAKRWVMHDK